MQKAEVSPTKRTMSDINKWVGRLRIKSNFYIRKIEEYPYLGVVCYPSGEKKFIICNTKNKKICDIGFFTEEGGFEEAFKNFKDGPFYEFNKDFIEKSIETYGFPIKDEKESEPKEEEATHIIEDTSATPEKDSTTNKKGEKKPKKLTYEDINNWFADLKINSKPYTKVVPGFPYALVSVRSKQQYGVKTLWFFNPTTRKRMFWVGDFSRKNAETLFKRITTFSKEAEISKIERAQIESILEMFGLPEHSYDMPEDDSKENNSDTPLLTIDKEVESKKIEEPCSTKKEIVSPKEAETKGRRDDYICVDYNTFIRAKNSTIREKVHEELFKYRAAMIAIYTVLALIVGILVFNSEYYLGTSFLNKLSLIFIFIAGSIWLGKKADRKLSEISGRLRNEHDLRFTLEDNVICDQILNKMIDNEVNDLARNPKKLLVYLLDSNSKDIPKEVHELKRSSNLITSFFVEEMEPKYREALVKKHLDRQAIFARKKASDLLHKIKCGDDAELAKTAMMSKNKINDTIKDILDNNNIIVE